ncbi:transporter [[Clostridium] fimetarium]|uniref:Citrate transporter n=1 Tax=[Clostridium] fimetarium TaxID=99656 RepID=A0A1I0QHC2_9FIRM|nr:transporter [[Clostridium] fimetarium]SEW26474.1 hypothetical protein SAMN05421659_10825 [[Clostridium] fimetarium]
MGNVINVQVVLILLVFIGAIILMMTKKLPAILALPILGIVIAVIAGVPFRSPAGTGGQTIMAFVIASGSAKLASTIMATIFGSIFAKIIQKQGIADAIIRKAAEMAGDKPVAIAVVLTAATAVIFTAISGAGPVIMVSTIVIPLLLSAGVAPVVSASLVLMGLSIGLLFNVANYQMYIDTIGMDIGLIKSTSLIMGAISAVVTLIYIFINVKQKSVRSSWAVPEKEAPKKVNVVAMLSPLVPIILVFALKFNAETSLLVAIVFTTLVTSPKKIIQVISNGVVEGTKDVAGVIGLMMGIGILLNGVTSTYTTALMQPLIKAVLPTSPVAYVIMFAVLSPLALYRGPLNMYGLGSGIANILLAAGTMNPAAIGMALRSTSIVQCVSDPTNTQNVITADFAKVDVNEILKSTLPYTMVIALITLVYTAIFIY